jgi:transcriptional regulator with XRE-family HTH domain
MATRNAMIEAMRRRDLSFRELAFLTDLSAPYLWRVAHGQRRPSKDAALTIAKALNIAPYRLAEGNR